MLLPGGWLTAMVADPAALAAAGAPLAGAAVVAEGEAAAPDPERLVKAVTTSVEERK